MLFNSIDFLIFFPIVTLAFFIIPKKARTIWLLLASYYFYMSWNPKYAVLILISTGITFASGFLIERAKTTRGKKLAVAGSLISNLGILAVFKYADFAIRSLNALANAMGAPTLDWQIDLLLPVGISFYTFQALSYTLDVYRGNIKPERNFIKYALFVSFFPQLVAGPIERSVNLLPQIQKITKIKVWNFDRVRDGVLLMCWGFFQKLMIADRAALLVNQVYTNYAAYGFLELALATVLFAFQIYCDFDGYTNIARGAARVLGIDLMKNFKQPYLATNIRSFWRRWHISLTSWFTDYVYIPLGGNRKGFPRKLLNIFIVFALSGLWHGASWNFVAWGLLHAFYMIAAAVFMRFKPRNNGAPLKTAQSAEPFSKKLGKILITFIFVDIAWVFFASDSFSHSVGIFKQMLTSFQTTGIFSLGLDRGNWAMLIFALAVLLIVDVLHEKGKSIFKLVKKQQIWFRWGLYLGLVWCVLLFGIYGPAFTNEFIYFQF